MFVQLCDVRYAKRTCGKREWVTVSLRVQGVGRLQELRASCFELLHSRRSCTANTKHTATNVSKGNSYHGIFKAGDTLEFEKFANRTVSWTQSASKTNTTRVRLCVTL